MPGRGGGLAQAADFLSFLPGKALEHLKYAARRWRRLSDLDELSHKKTPLR
jgi:hypothetical protein